MGVNGLAAAQTLLGFGRVNPGYCLYYVWQAYKAHGARTGMNSPTALDAWHKSQGKHPGDRNPPAGVPVFWGAKSSSSAGDVVISLGNGRVAVTEVPGGGSVTGSCTIDERERQIGRPYLGWTEKIFDVAIDFTPNAAPQPAPTNTGNSGRKPTDVLAWNWNGIAAMLRRYAGYRGNNVPGPIMVAKLQWWLNNSGYSKRAIGRNLRIDSDFGPNTLKAVQMWLKVRWGYTGPIDADPGDGTRGAWNRAEAANWQASPQWRQ